MIDPFWPLLGSHILGDMIFNSSRLAIFKRDARMVLHVTGIASHCLLHAGFAAVLLAATGWPVLGGTLLVFFSHFVIDFCRCNLEKKIYGPGRLLLNRAELFELVRGRRQEKLPPGTKLWAAINVCDQASHLACLFALSRWLIFVR